MDMRIAALIIFITIPFLLLTVWMLVDISLKRFPTPSEKAVWWFIALIPFVGWFIYLVIGFRRGEKSAGE